MPRDILVDLGEKPDPDELRELDEETTDDDADDGGNILGSRHLRPETATGRTAAHGRQHGQAHNRLGAVPGAQGGHRRW